MIKYLKEKSLIPQHNLVEVSFDDLENRPLQILEEIYGKLDIPGFMMTVGSFKKYLENSKSYKKNKHRIKRETLGRVLSEWDFAMKEWNYDVPDNVEIVD
jgi:hypothetical protein